MCSRCNQQKHDTVTVLSYNVPPVLVAKDEPNVPDHRGYYQGRRNDVKARGADFRERALLNLYILRDVFKTSGVELRLIMFSRSIYWMIGV